MAVDVAPDPAAGKQVNIVLPCLQANVNHFGKTDCFFGELIV
jgi:hypothetical protein